jgi:hypothetical protein
MPVVTQEQHNIMLGVERIARNYKLPRSECLVLVKLGFEAGMIAGVNQYALSVTSQMNEGVCPQS